MAAQDQRGDVQAHWRLSEKPSTRTRSWPCTASASQAYTCQRPERKARAQGLNHAWRELLELVSLHTVLLGRGGVLS
jgi:hypothetical protein